jgi:hypothetical protein
MTATAIKEKRSGDRSYEEQIIIRPSRELLGAGLLRYDLPPGVLGLDYVIIIIVSSPKADKVEVEQWYSFRGQEFTQISGNGRTRGPIRITPR